MLDTEPPAERDPPTRSGTPTITPHATRLVLEGIFATICQLLNPCLDLKDPETNDPEAYREVPKQVLHDRRALACLARTCRAFSECALNALWRRLDSPEPLLRLLLAGVRSVTVDDPRLAGDPFEGTTTIFLHPQPPEQLNRFGLYARRVETLNLLKEATIHPSAFFQAAMVCNVHMKGRMLPALKELYCEPSETMDQAIMLFASLGLKRVTLNLAQRTVKPKLTMTRADLALSSVMICLARTAPAIQELSVTDVSFPQMLHNIHCLAKLETLDIRGTECTGYLLQRLSCLEHLTSITLTASAGGLQNQSSAFARLKHVRFVGGTFVGAARVLLSLGLCTPTSLDIHGATATSVYCLHKFAVSAFSVCLRAEGTLNSLSIRGTVCMASQDRTDDAEIPRISLVQFLQSLVICKKLSALTVSLERLVTVSDEDISYLAAKWPLLTQLDLVGISAADPPPSFSGIAHLLRACPRLRVLKLPMLAAPTRDPAEWPVLDNALEVLVVAKQLYLQRPARVCVDERECIAEIADRLFPSLDEHESCEATKALPNGVKCRWRRIVDELAYLRYLRRERGLPDIFFVKVSEKKKEDCLSAEHWFVGMTSNGIHEIYKRTEKSQ